MESVQPSSSISLRYETRSTTMIPSAFPSVPSTNYYMNINNIIIIIIFCVVCFLLLAACLYAFCFHCALRCAHKDSATDGGCSLEREDTTVRRTSSNVSVGNVI